MKALRIIVPIFGVCVVAPIWYYLLYKLLLAVNATELMWFLYWIYLPVAFLCGVITSVIESQKQGGFHEKGELLASATRDSWEEAERAAKKEAEKHFTYGPVPAPKTVEIEVPDPEPKIELTEVFVEKQIKEVL